MQSSDLPRRIPLAFADSGTKNVIPEGASSTPGIASLTTGFPPLCFTPVEAGGLPPAGADFNGMFNYITAIQRWQCAGGQFTYNGAFAVDSNVGGYPLGALLLRADGTGQWLNTAENNTTSPETGGAGWVAGWNYGFTMVAMASTNVTMTALQAAKDTIIITGALTADVNLVFPAQTRKWTVINNATGAHTVTCKTPSGTGIAVATGVTAVLYGDGANIGDTALVSRAELTAAVATALANAAPTGEIKLWSMNAAPTGYLECDGAAINRTTYAALFAVIGTTFGVGNGSTTFNIPDMRGQFARGWDHGAGVDPARTFGSGQQDAEQGHYHTTLTTPTGTGGFAIQINSSGGNSYPTDGSGLGGLDPTTGAPVTDGTHGTPRIASETRPVNVAMMYIIKI